MRFQKCGTLPKYFKKKQDPKECTILIGPRQCVSKSTGPLKFGTPSIFFKIADFQQ